MSEYPEILFLITARGGSKGIPKKNLRKINGLSLIGYKAKSALKSKYCSRLVISSDSPELQAEAASFGVEVLFDRPHELASDTASSDDVILHAMEYFETRENKTFDAIMLLEPASPFARAGDYDAAVEIYMKNKASLVVSMRETEVHSIFVGPLREDGRADQIINKFADIDDLNRQAFELEYTMTGSLYLIDWKFFRKSEWIYGDAQNTYGYVMDKAHSTEIEAPDDLLSAEFLARNGNIDKTEWQ